MKGKTVTIGLLLILTIAIWCEIDTTLSVEGGNPPKVMLSGNGTLSRLVVRGHKALRKIDGPDSSAVWYIQMDDYESGRKVWSLSPITYGRTPKGYHQVYPQQGDAPQLEENVTYYIQVDTMNANGANGNFIIKDGQIRFAKYQSQLADK